MIRHSFAMLLGFLILTEAALADGPLPVPLTRADMKKALENSKHVKPRLPLPPPTEEERARAEEAARARAAEAAKAGEGDVARNGPFGLGRGLVNNARMRGIYLSDYNIPGISGPGNSRRQGATRQGGFGRQTDPASGLTYPFQTQLFWIVSRGNNCTYCMGHQEAKLAAAGQTDDQIAALDGDLSEFSDKERAAFRFTKKLTHEPHAITDQDIDTLRRYFNDAQITDIILSVAGFNATNRWTGPLRITQESRHEFLKSTSPKYTDVLSRVAPFVEGSAGTGFAQPAPRVRPALESRPQVEAALQAARERTPRLKLADESAARALLNGTIGDAPLAQWMRLAAVLPATGPNRVATLLSAERNGTLDKRTKAIIFWVAARNDRAWYALGHARKRLQALGFSDAQMFALDQPEELGSAVDREVVNFAKKIAVDPALVDDGDFERMRKHFDDKKVAEIVYQVTQAAFFDRLTEAAGLQLEP